MKVSTEIQRIADSGLLNSTNVQMKSGTKRMRAIVMMFGKLKIDLAVRSIRFDFSEFCELGIIDDRLVSKRLRRHLRHRRTRFRQKLLNGLHSHEE